MYTPKYYKIEDEKVIYDVIRDNSFAVLVTTNNGKINATHIPVLLGKDSEGVQYLFGHISSGNLQWKDISEDVLVIFQGPHQYISSSWYETDQSVPTWNYVAVHVYGKIEMLEDREESIRILKDTVQYFEAADTSYDMKNLEPDYFEKLLKGIRTFKIKIDSLEGKWKLSQNHTEERKNRVITELEKAGDENSKAIADYMKENLKQKKEDA